MKRIIFLVILSLVINGCSESSGSGTIVPPPVDNEKPVAVDDIVNTIEDDELVLADLLSNDTVITGARITSFDASSTKGGTIVDNRNGTYSYVPPSSFVGQDSFTYTLCDNDTNPDCSTATVTITVSDEGSPNAVNDEKSTVKNMTVLIDNYLENDNLLDDSTINTIDDTSSTGTVVLNANGTISYTPQNNFVGDDSFNYTICDDDTPNPTCATATITVSILEPISFNIPSDISTYYQNLAVTTDTDLNYTFIGDHTIDNHTTILIYTQRHDYLYDADEDPANTANVILMYTSESRDEREYDSPSNPYSPKTFNTEHVYPQSKLSTDDAVTDLHHLRSCDTDINSERSNYPFVAGSGTYQLVNNNQWYPGDEWRGDVARMIMYLNIRYGETFEDVGTLDLFLEWNATDPVSAFEIQRNNIIQGAQGNRNPFIDNPYLATLIWGGTPAENKWE